MDNIVMELERSDQEFLSGRTRWQIANFSPATNLLPIRRLGLLPGEEALVRAAWLRFPSFTFEPLEQRYFRGGEMTYRYESAGGRFIAELDVDENGFVTSSQTTGKWRASPEWRWNSQ